MKKVRFLACVLTCVMFLSMLVPSAAAEADSSSEVPTSVVHNAATIVVDGKMGDGEYGETPHMVLNKPVWNDLTVEAATATSYPNLYLSTDGDNLYMFYEIRKDVIRTGADSLLYFSFETSDNALEKGWQSGGQDGYDGEIQIRLGMDETEGRENGIEYYYYKKSTNCSDQTGVEISLGSYEENGATTFTAELKIPLMPDVKEEMTRGGKTIKFGALQRRNILVTKTDGGTGTDWSLTGETSYKWNKSVNTTLLELRGAVDLEDKSVTVDGSMGSSEGWAATPFLYLDSLRTDPTSASTQETVLAEKKSTVRVSYDASCLYLFLESYQAQKDSVYFQIGYGGADKNSENAVDNYIEIHIDTTANAVSTAGNTSPVTYLGTGKTEYTAGNAIFDGTKAAVVIDGSKTSVEVAVPIPETVCEARKNGAYSDISFGTWERFTASDTTGLVASFGYDWNVGKLNLSMNKQGPTEKDALLSWIEESKTTAYHESMKGITVSVLGDEGFAGDTLDPDYVWPALLATKYEWTFNNYGKNGNLLSAYNNIDTLPMVRRYAIMSNNKPDVIIVNGGLNDFYNEVPLGTLASKDTETFMGAMNVLINGLRGKYPNACLIFTTAWNFSETNELGLTYQDYVDAMEEVCTAKKVYFFQANDPEVSGIDLSDETFRSTYCLTAETESQLNLEGMKLVMPKLESFINESLAHWAENKEEILAAFNQNNSTGNDNNEQNTTAPTETKAPAESTAAPATEEEGGCKSSLNPSACFVLLAIVACAAVVCSKRRGTFI